jgi:hypothetical protein
VQEAQDNLRLSAQQTNKLNLELNDFRQRYESTYQESETYKQKILKLQSESSSLSE